MLEHRHQAIVLVEARERTAGTWDLFRYPGVRSDSDMFTLGYAFRPWTGAKAIADGQAIREYIVDTAREYGVEEKIRFHHEVLSADWSSADSRWTVTARRTDTGETVQLTCSWLSVCSGYYRYDEGFRPEFPGEQRFTGEIVHPQHWPADFDATGKRIVVIGSGATAVTLVPNLADAAEHVTMLQRTPSYIMSLPGKDPLAELLRTQDLKFADAIRNADDDVDELHASVFEKVLSDNWRARPSPRSTRPAATSPHSPHCSTRPAPPSVRS